MSPSHLRTILWLRWRLLRNQLARGGSVNATLLFGLAGILTLGSLVAFFVALFGGMVWLRTPSAQVVMVVWDVLVVSFLFFWLIGLLAELQRSEPLSLEKLMHLPVSLGAAFFTNYLSSLASLTLLFFLPAMIGTAIALLITRGAALLLLFPLIAAFVFMVTALTYQFQGWLAALMSTPRKRRTVVALVTVALVVIFQLPNLVNVLVSRRPAAATGEAQRDAERARLDQAHARRELDDAMYVRRWKMIDVQYQARVDARMAESSRRAWSLVSSLNVALPIGWLPYGARACVNGRLGPALLGCLGLFFIGAASLRGSYRAAVRLHSGHLTSRPRRAEPRLEASGGERRILLERRLPWVPEQAVAIALASFRSLLRAPEAKVLLMSPILMMVGMTMFLRTGSRLGPAARPFLALGIAGTLMFGILHLVVNQFGIDRTGFRALVLSPSRRRDILLGKNLAVAPLALGIAVIAVIAFGLLTGMRTEHFLATFPAMASLFLLVCMLGNLSSILAPVTLAAGSLKPASPSAATTLVQLGLLLVLPLLYGVALLPLFLEHSLPSAGAPIYLIGACLELAGIILAYRAAIRWQGRLLERREQHILAVVAKG
jgi:hypothetical protein